MIICHPLKLIFIKTKKVGGTSFEIALSSCCGPDCVITPITPRDEATRTALGYRGPQNVVVPAAADGSRSGTTFYNHMPAEEVKRNVPDEIWRTYNKITIWRDPFDAAISRYHWEFGPQPRTSFIEFLREHRAVLTENIAIAPLSGPAALDRYLRYENLEHDVRDLGIEGLWERFAALRAKGHLRPPQGASPAEVYGAHPEAVRIVAETCADEIRHFGYRPPVEPAPSAPAVLRHPAQPPRYYFTLTAGRTGTGWLARFLEANLGIESIHEPLGINDFGTRMPDLRTMRAFNSHGLDDRYVRHFWRRKLATLPSRPYAETNHTLGKCGLIEAIAESDLADRVKIIVLTRDIAKQCTSYIARHDFSNVTILWQWYLDHRYPNVILRPEQLLRQHPGSLAFWYAFEVAARQSYYQQLYSDRLTFVPAALEEIGTADGARNFLERLGAPSSSPVLPPKYNYTARERTDQISAAVRAMLAKISVTPETLATQYIASGRRLHDPMPGANLRAAV